MTVKLLHFKNTSAVSVFDKNTHYGWIIYQRKIHKFESESDYKTLVTENNTYSDKAVIDTFNYMKGARA